jgi:Na+/melibiose symporter-like transporter
MGLARRRRPLSHGAGRAGAIQEPMNAAPRPSTGDLAAFVAPCLPLAGVGLPLVLHLPTYYARDLGLPLGAVGFAFLAVRLADIGVDPALGVLMDRTRSRLGRFRPWLILSVPILIAGALMLFMARPGVSAAWLWLGLVVIYLGFSMGSLAQQAWASALSPDYDQRSRIYGWWQTGNVLGILLALLISPAVELGLKGSRAQGIQAMGWTMIILLPLTIAFAIWRVGEPPADRQARGARRPGDYLDLLRDPAIARLMLADLLMGWAPGITAALFLFYFDQIKRVPEVQANILLLIYFVAAMLGAPVWSWLAVRVGKHRALAVNALCIPASLVLVMLTPMRHFAVAAGVMALAGLPYSGASLLLRAMLADAGDQLRLTTGIDRTALLYSVLSGTGKVGSALALTTFIMLDALGFHTQGHDNSPAALQGLQAMFVGLPTALSLLSAVVIIGYRLDAPRHAEIRAALARRGAVE